MTLPERDARFQKLELSPDAVRGLTQHNIVRDLDRGGQPHLLIKVPELGSALQADVGIEVSRGEDGSVAVSVLLYDIPTEPVTYDLRFYPDRSDDLKYLKGFLDAAHFRLHPCALKGGHWMVGPSQSFEVPTDVLLRLRHFAKEWAGERENQRSEPAEPKLRDAASTASRSLDPRDTVIRKLKEQVQALRDQLQERDKRIIDLEDELHEIRSRGRPYKLSAERRSWWKPFS